MAVEQSGSALPRERGDAVVLPGAAMRLPSVRSYPRGAISAAASEPEGAAWAATPCR